MPDTFAFPLSDFYTHAKLPLPPIEIRQAVAPRTTEKPAVEALAQFLILKNQDEDLMSHRSENAANLP